MSAKQSRGTIMFLREIARAGYLPAGPLARALKKLRRHALLCSRRAAVRGRRLARSPEETRPRDMLEAIEGPTIVRRCIVSPRPGGEAHRRRPRRERIRIGGAPRTATRTPTLFQVAARRPRRH